MRRRSVIVGAVARRPDLWPTALRQAVRLAPVRWWARAPFLPIPDRRYLQFRMVTQYGGTGRVRPEPRDVISYLTWCRALRGIGG